MEYHLNRFVDAQNRVYEQVIKELSQGRKTSHWMWFIFPQIKGLSHSVVAKRYAIASLAEAKEYYSDHLLAHRLIECSQILLSIKGKTAEDILGHTDAMKLKSSMTLFSLVSDDSVFTDILDLYFDGKKDDMTLAMIGTE